MLLSEKTKVIFLKVFFPCFLCENEDKVFCIIKKNDSCIDISIHDLKWKKWISETIDWDLFVILKGNPRTLIYIMGKNE